METISILQLPIGARFTIRHVFPGCDCILRKTGHFTGGINFEALFVCEFCKKNYANANGGWGNSIALDVDVEFDPLATALEEAFSDA